MAVDRADDSDKASVTVENADRWRRLDAHRRSVTSQFGEDGLIAYLVGAFPEIPKTCLEVGAGDGRHFSNTHTLWADQGWRAFLIESEQPRFEGLADAVSGRDNVTAIQAMITPRGDASLDALTELHGFPADIGVVSIDIDADDYRIFEGLTRIKASIVVIEVNHEIPIDVDYVDADGDPFLRHSAKAVDGLARSKGFRTVACAGPNLILLREDLITSDRADAVPDLPIEALWDHAYARSKQTATQAIRSKSYTDLVAFHRKPKAIERLFWRAHYAALRVRGLYLGRQRGRTSVGSETRRRLRKAGLWI